MKRLAEPPSIERIQASSPSWATVTTATTLWRIFPRSGPHPTAWRHVRTWGPAPSARFDPHEPGPGDAPVVQERGVMYVAFRVSTCIAEVFQATRTIDRRRDDPTLVAFATVRPLRLLDLWGPWATRVGASGALSSDGDRRLTQRWARALYTAFPDADGLRYESSMLPGQPVLALFERATSALPPHPRLHRALADPDLSVPVVRAARELGYVLTP